MAGQGALEFRKDINGLRAYAVVAVLLYHFGITGMGGGYAGVDMFFVISGFLMTAIILPRVEEGRFSLSGFYLARVRRILPALAVLCAAVLLFGWFWLAPYLYENLGKARALRCCSFPTSFTTAPAAILPIRRTTTGCCTPGRFRSSGSSTCSTRCCYSCWRA